MILFHAFSLSSAPSPHPITNPPSWFTFAPGEVEVLQAPDGMMQLAFAKTHQLLYATAAGGGFTKAVEAPTPNRVVPAANPGGLPTTPPPNPPTP